MTRILLLIPAAAALALAACNDSSHTIVQNGPADPMANELKNAPPVQLPPSIASSKVYRCKDNSLVYADFYTDNTARVRTEKDGTPTILNSTGGQPPYTAEGWSLSANADQVTLTAPGKGTQSCKA